jgi:hypothetical protein
MIEGIKLSEIRRGSIRLVRVCRVVTYLVGEDSKGREEVICEVPDEGAKAIIQMITEGEDDAPV